MKYSLTLRLIGCPNSVDISESRFEEIRSAKKLLLHCLFVEEKYDLALQNYAAFERILVDHALNNLVFSPVSSSEIINGINLINLPLINLLSTCRLYLDHTVHHVREMFGDDSSVEEAFVVKTNEQYDSSLGYRALSAMRNYVQHRGYPVHCISIGGSWDDGRKYRHTSVAPYTKLATIEEDRKFKSSVLQEMKEIANEKGMIDLRPLVRDYLSCIGKVHQVFRAESKTGVSGADEILKTAISDYLACGDDKSVGLAAVAKNDDGNVVEHVEIFSDFIKRREGFAQKNSGSTPFENQFVSNAVHL